MPTRISDARLAELARRREEYKAEAADLARKAQEVDAKILTELERRGTRVLEVEGIRLTRTVQERTTIDWDGLHAVLDARQWRLVTKRVPDRNMLEEAVRRNVVPAEAVVENSTVQANKPYLTVTQGAGT